MTALRHPYHPALIADHDAGYPVFDFAVEGNNFNPPSKSKDGMRLPPPSGGTSFRPIDWSPDGTKILGQVFDDGVAKQLLAIYDLSRARFRIIETPSNLFFLSAVWLSDNRRILYSLANTIYLFDTETGVRKSIWTDAAGASIQLTVSADDATVFYSRGVSEGDIWLATFE